MEAGSSNQSYDVLEKLTEEELQKLFELESPKNMPKSMGPAVPEESKAEPKVDEKSAATDPGSDANISRMEKNLFVFNADKAGMGMIDHDHVGKVIEEASKGSEYYKKQKEKLDAMKHRVVEKKLLLEEAKKDKAHYEESELNALLLIDEIRNRQCLDRTWVHIDMDMFFAAVEIRDQPALADKPVAVGGYSMISTANYVARKFGVRSAMPGFIGKKLCPDLVFVQCNYQKYREVSEQVMSILQEYDPNMECMGLDEANLDVTDYMKSHKLSTDTDRMNVAKEIQQRVYDKVKLTASCGVGANRLLAKISCDMHKPNGITFVPFDAAKIEEFMAPLSVRKIPGVGKVGEQQLNGLGIATCKDVIDNATDLYVLFNESNFEFYVHSALGVGRNEHEECTEGIQKSISVSRTFRNISQFDPPRAKALR